MLAGRLSFLTMRSPAVDRHREHRLTVVRVPAQPALRQELHAGAAPRQGSAEYPFGFSRPVQRCGIEGSDAVVDGTVDQAGTRRSG